jgi:hypothetical protein
MPALFPTRKMPFRSSESNRSSLQQVWLHSRTPFGQRLARTGKQHIRTASRQILDLHNSRYFADYIKEMNSEGVTLLLDPFASFSLSASLLVTKENTS